ncbi:MAG: hypothetical protein E6Q68_08475 [Polynucleobacter sp.]|nr:MAG: hypothetical protein E6Q68_08475 [Polynucleobacter sp.]
MIIGIDFDGTCVTHEFPYIGNEIGAGPVLKKLVDNNHKLILFTMRSDIVDPRSENPAITLQPGDYLSEAVKWFEKKGIPLYGVNVNPTQHTWTKSPKAYCELYIDDAALGIPLKHDIAFSSRPFVDWEKVSFMLMQKRLI